MQKGTPQKSSGIKMGGIKNPQPIFLPVIFMPNYAVHFQSASPERQAF